MPKLELTMDQWGLVLRSVRYAYNTADWRDEDKFILCKIEDRVIDMAFQIAKEAEDMLTSKKEIDASNCGH